MENIYKLYTDGSNQNYNQLAGYGGYIESDNGKRILSFSEVVTDPSLNNKHELLGLKKGLQLSIREGIKNIICYTDDLTMARIINTKDKDAIKESIKHPLHNEILELKNYFDNIEVLYIPREENKEADKFSRKALNQYIIDNNINGIPNKPYFKCDKLITRNQFKNKDQFSELNRKITNYIVFNESISNKMDIYLVKKDISNNEITEQLIESIDIKRNNQQEMLEIISSTLNNNTHLKECAFFSMSAGNKSQILEDMLRGHGYITPSIKETIIDFEESINKFDRVFYHKDQKIVNHLNAVTAIKIPNITFVLTPENIIQAIRELGEDDYYLGKNPKIEHPSKIKEGQDSILELQKYYFGKFLNLGMRDLNQMTHKISKEEKNNIIKERIQSMRDNLTNQGIKLKM